MSNEVWLKEIYEGYHLKYDGPREKDKWTAIGPSGRIGPDYNTEKEARDAIKREKDRSG